MMPICGEAQPGAAAPKKGKLHGGWVDKTVIKGGGNAASQTF